MRVPCAGVPAPGGKPAPSGCTLMSHAPMAAGLIGWPRWGPAAAAAPAASQSARHAAAIIPLGVHMLDLPRAVNRPAGDGVEVLVRKRHGWRDRLHLPTFGHKLGAGRLHVAGLVPGAALQDGGTAVPAPGHAKAGEGLTQHRSEEHTSEL